MGPTRTTATKLIAITLPIATVEFAARFRTIAISGGSKPKINPTPKLVEKTAARTHRVQRSLTCIKDNQLHRESGVAAPQRARHRACRAISLRTSKRYVTN